ncbi:MULTISPECIES: hypothetical protein [unclassified Pseudomonas]|uniref:hypothetical protein n=1 Tax=unclassified Pseudomonas TaxID=196821 RepID=UPI0025F0F2DD|nr:MULTISPECIES: hypothetical protein [unclassified Pseudomonas]
MASSFKRRQAPGHIREEQVEGVGEFAGNVVGTFGRTAQSYEVQAGILARGMQAALFVERFKKGLLKVPGRE